MKKDIIIEYNEDYEMDGDLKIEHMSESSIEEQ
jgi:hypothetical protein